MSLTEILKKKKCFKVVCGAGNEDSFEVEKLVSLYSQAGAQYFDLSAKKEVVLAAQRALDRSVPKEERKNFFLNVSVGIKGDPHVSKAVIDQEKCTACGACQPACEIQKAIDQLGTAFSVNHVRCIGCGNCLKVCPVDAITLISKNEPLPEVLPPLIDLGLDSLELHAVTEDEDGAYGQWALMQGMFPGMLSLCLDRSCLGDAQLLARIKRFLAGRKEFMTILQADGAPMSGADDKPGTTLQALATGQVVAKAQLPVYLMLSGGTNSKTAALAKEFGVAAHGVAVGSYARKIVKEYIDRDDFLTNKEVFQRALTIARALVDNTLRFMGT